MDARDPPPPPSRIDWQAPSACPSRPGRRAHRRPPSPRARDGRFGCDTSAGSFWIGAAVGLATGVVLPRLLALAVDAWTFLARRHDA